MAGAHLDIDVIGLDRVQRVLGRLSEASQDVDPILRDIGEHLLTSTKDRFSDEEGPDGRSWETLDLSYAEEKKRKRPNAGILVYDNFLRGTLAYDVSGGELALGTNLPYGARQRFIPARAGNTSSPCSRPIGRSVHPARAGNTGKEALGVGNPAVHPRAGGEHCSGALCSAPLRGSSPRGRGTPTE